MVSVEQVSTPAKEPDPTCRAVPRGADPPEHCRASYLRAEQFWRVTVDVGNKRFVVRPYRAPKLINALNSAGTVYVDPNLKAAASVEVAVVSNKTIRLRADQGPGLPAIVDSQVLLSKSEVAAKAELPAPTPHPKARAPIAPAPVTSAPVTSGAKVVLLENSDFSGLEIQEFKSQDIGDGAVLYSFAGDTSPTKSGSNTPVFLVLADSEAAMHANVELSRLQVGKGTRQMAYSATKNHSASALPIVVTQVSATVRKVKVMEPLTRGSYVVLLENSNSGFLFDVR